MQNRLISLCKQQTIGHEDELLELSATRGDASALIRKRFHLVDCFSQLSRPDAKIWFNQPILLHDTDLARSGPGSYPTVAKSSNTTTDMLLQQFFVLRPTQQGPSAPVSDARSPTGCTDWLSWEICSWRSKVSPPTWHPTYRISQPVSSSDKINSSTMTGLTNNLMRRPTGRRQCETQLVCDSKVRDKTRWLFSHYCRGMYGRGIVC